MVGFSSYLFELKHLIAANKKSFIFTCKLGRKVKFSVTFFTISKFYKLTKLVSCAMIFILLYSYITMSYYLTTDREKQDLTRPLSFGLLVKDFARQCYLFNVPWTRCKFGSRKKSFFMEYQYFHIDTLYVMILF